MVGVDRFGNLALHLKTGQECREEVSSGDAQFLADGQPRGQGLQGGVEQHGPVRRSGQGRVIPVHGVACRSVYQGGKVGRHPIPALPTEGTLFPSTHREDVVSQDTGTGFRGSRKDDPDPIDDAAFADLLHLRRKILKPARFHKCRYFFRDSGFISLHISLRLRLSVC